MGLGHKIALILFYFKIDIYKSITPEEDLARYWNCILYLSEIDLLSLAQLPLKFEECPTNK
jgi:hypothetical protein